MIHKIHGKYLLQELFTYISENKKLKLIRNNKHFIKKLDITIDDFKINYFHKKIKEYDDDILLYINDYYIEFCKDFSSIIENKEELRTLFFNSLSKNNNFDLNILDEDFDYIFKNQYFKKKIRINIEGLSIDLFKNIKLLLIKNNKLTDKAIKIFKDIFILFSTNGRMNKIQYTQFVNFMMNIQIDENCKYIKNFFSKYDLDNDGLLSFVEFSNFYLHSIKNKIDTVWKHLYFLGYNNLLEKNNKIDYSYILNHQEEFEISTYTNIMKISKEKIYKLSLFNYIDKIFLQYFNNNQLFKYLKILDISNYNLNQIINLNITCPNIEELNLKVIENNLAYNINEFNNIFPNMKVFNIFIEINFNLFSLLRILKYSKIENLKIYIEQDDNYKIDSKILLKNIKNLEIKGYNINNFLCHFFNNIELPNLQKYIINIDINKINNINFISNNNDYNIVNQFIIDILDKKKFILKRFFSLPNKLKSIKHLELYFQLFSFVYKNKEGKNYLFKFNINNKNEFKQYYYNIDLSIDANEIITYKKIDIKGTNYENKENIKEIIEKEDINLCDIYFNLNFNQYFIKSFKNLKTIYCEDEISISNLNKLLNQNLDNLKYINLTIGDISNNFYILSKLIKNPNLKSIILRLHSNIFNNKNIINLFKFIENSKKLRVINITQNGNKKHDISLKTILEQFPNLEKKKCYFDEFIIGNEILVSKKKCILTYKINKDDLNNKIKLLGSENKEISNKCILYLKNKEINGINYEFFREGNYKFKLIFNEYLINMSFMYSNCSSLTSLNLSNFNTNNVNNMSSMFSNCSSLTSLNLSNFNTNNVEDMSSMFYYCSSLTSLNLSNFNTNNVNNMCCMFFKCTSLTSLNLSNFNTNNVKDMSDMFYYCSSLTSLNLSNFNTNNVKDMRCMFCHCSLLTSLNLSNFNTNKVEDMSLIFNYCSSLTSLNLSNFNTNNVNNMGSMFCNCSSLTSLNLSNFNTNKVKYMNHMFCNCSSLTSLNLSNFNTNNVQHMDNMFSNCSSLTSLNLSNFNTNNVEDMREMLYGLKNDCKIFSNDINIKREKDYFGIVN